MQPQELDTTRTIGAQSGPVVVVGAGISGLCAAYRLKGRGAEVIVLEKGAEAGGTMQTQSVEGWLVEAGPNSALESTPLLGELFQDLGITAQRCYANERASKRYILRGGRLLAIPTTPSSVITSPLWSLGGKLRILKEPFIGRAYEEESVAQFVTRRLGHEFLDYAIDPFVAGVYAGDPEKLSIRAAFPKMYALESNHGGLFKGMIALKRKRKGTGGARGSKLFSFVRGMQTIPRAIASDLGAALRLNASVENIVPMRAGKNPVHVVSVRQEGKLESITASAVVLASPAVATGAVIRAIDPETAGVLESVYYPPVASVFLGFCERDIGRPLDGFGFLVPKREERNILGAIWSSALFPGRSPHGCAAITAFVGGSRRPDLVSLDDQALVDLLLTELRTIMNIGGDPVFRRINRWERAIPQYTMGYERVLRTIDRFEQNFRGAFVCSNFRGGISVGDCVTNATAVAERVVQHLST
jgi:oxygen-dependent protoporphyrinogen oxidase